MHTDSERPNIQDNKQDLVWKILMLKDKLSIGQDWDVETPIEKWGEPLRWQHLNGSKYFKAWVSYEELKIFMTENISRLENIS